MEQKIKQVLGTNISNVANLKEKIKHCYSEKMFLGDTAFKRLGLVPYLVPILLGMSYIRKKIPVSVTLK